MKSMELPDQNHIEQIRSRLWAGREFGQAAVMVGAGFSRNAERISASVQPFPLWHQLAERMYEQLYPSESDRGAMLRATSGGGALRLASVFEKFFGRQALDEMLLDTIPDSYYQPGELHNLLLSLPWSDVFTTNYDTLLERTQPAVYERKYDVILSPSDIPGRMKPRIVKLHGSFPSLRPFILTEEDYRTYPSRFGPFVNMVQQSIMENAFCLIGFSGDDPNFFYWSGWVRDHLGAATPPIYLCGLLDLSTPTRRLLESRGINPIDLSPMFPEVDWPDQQTRHSAAIKWLLRNLCDGAPPNKMTWPIAGKRKTFIADESCPPIARDPHPPSGHGKQAPKKGTFEKPDSKELQEICADWRRDRENYPGWVLAPHPNREELWRYTARWIEPVFRGAALMEPPPEDLRLVYEMNWRLEVTLSPLHLTWARAIERILFRYSPYPRFAQRLSNLRNERKEEGLEVDDSQVVCPTEDRYKILAWTEIRKNWVELAFAVARNAREDQQFDIFKHWMQLLEPIVAERREWQVRWYHERCLFYLFRFEGKLLRRALEEWPEMRDQPFGESKRAAILAEIGNLREAKRTADAALAEIRSRFQPYFADHALLSQEGWTLALLKLIDEALDQEPSSTEQVPSDINLLEFQSDRWEKLQHYGCNPWPEIETMRLVLERSAPTVRAVQEVDQELLSARGNPHFIADLRPAFGFLRIFEEGALPIYCRTTRFATSVVNAVRSVEFVAPLWALSCMIRTSLDDHIKSWFHRARVGSLSKDEVKILFDWFRTSLEESINYLISNLKDVLKQSDFAARQIRIIPELLSRLSLRCDEEQRGALLNLAIEVYNLQHFQQLDSYHDCIRTMFDNLLSLAMKPDEIVGRLADLLDLPVPTEGGFYPSSTEKWAEPFSFIQWPEGWRLPRTFDTSAWNARTAGLLGILKHGESDARARAALRLARLEEIGGLTSEQRAEFGRELWERGNPLEDLPSVPPSALLAWPAPRGNMARERIREHFHAMLAAGSSNEAGDLLEEVLRVTLMRPRARRGWKPLAWTPEDRLLMVGSIESWWKNPQSSNGNLASDLQRALKVLALVVWPEVTTRESEARQRAADLIAAIDAHELPLSLAPLRLALHAASADEISGQLLKGLQSRSHENARQAVHGLSIWLEHSDRMEPPPALLLAELTNRIFTSRPPLLLSVLETLSSFVRRQPQTVSNGQMAPLFDVLKYFMEETSFELEREDHGNPALIPDHVRPEYRMSAAWLAYRLSALLRKRKLPPPEILEQWHQVVESEPIPQVRNTWRGIAVRKGGTDA